MTTQTPHVEPRTRFIIKLMLTDGSHCAPMWRSSVVGTKNTKEFCDVGLSLRFRVPVSGPEQEMVDNVLTRVLPAQISRFFLFDSKLLQEYEELLQDESEVGRMIFESIERILEVPILKRGRAHLMTLVDEASSEATREASRSKQTLAIGTALEQAGERKEAIKKIDANIKKLTDELARMAPENLRASQVKSSLLRAASEVFDAAIDRYKRDLRGKVESTASDIFLRMTAEGSDYERLEITESYGLNIIHKDSRIEEGRSAGAEHVVALALMGALQANAPLRGPIVMDSPFGRLDEGHTKNVVAALPTMAPQVVLLVHEAELRRNNVREILGSRLLREYDLVKVSARRTRIEPVR